MSDVRPAALFKPEDKPARHRKKHFRSGIFKEDLKTFIPHPAEHPDEKSANNFG